MNPEAGRRDRGGEFSFSRIKAAAELPLFPRLPAICRALEEKGIAVVRADPGSGKSTLVPLALMEWRDGKSAAPERPGRIIMLEPRRAAVLGIASRIAELLGEEPGERAGYSVRLERRVSGKTRIEVVTGGLLVRRMQENPELSGVAVLIFDEFHERSLYADLALAFALDLRRMGSSLRILVMSATMDAPKIAAFIDSAEGRGPGNKTPLLDCPGRLFPVGVSYRPLPRKQPLGKECAAVLEEIAREARGDAGDILVFLPGRREIAGTAAALRERGLDGTFEILSLYGALPLKEQRRIIAGQGAGGRRVILSTNVAETSLTIPGVGLVVDSGLARVERFHLPTGMNRLSLEPIGRNSADQRAGRAGRLGPGRCVRLWPETERRAGEGDSEIRRVDLSGAVLDCLLWGVREREALPWLESPPEAAWNRALELLAELGMTGGDGRPTETGRAAARLGLEPRLGRLCLEGLRGDTLGGRHTRGGGAVFPTCAAAAILAERDASGLDDADFRLRLEILRKNPGEPWALRILESAADLYRRLYAAGLCGTGLCEPGRAGGSWTAEDEANIGELLAAAFPDRIARRQEAEGRGPPGSGEGIFRFPGGREARIRGALAREKWLCALDVDAGERQGFIRLAAPLSEARALEILEKQALEDIKIEWKGLVPRTFETRRAGRLVLSEKRRPSLRKELLPALGPLLREKGLVLLPWEGEGSGPRRLLERIRFFAAHGTTAPSPAGANAGGPGQQAGQDWTEEALIRDAADWLGPFLRDGAENGKGPVLEGGGLLRALENRLGWKNRQELDRLVPEMFILPAGKKKRIDYSSGEPVLRLRLQDAFGISSVCKILSVSIIFHLLSPADRPVQITRDPAGFWSGSYAEVRKEMKGRYPKHYWPENPMSGADRGQ